LDQRVAEPGSLRFLTLQQVADELSTSRAQIYALVRSGALAAIKIGGRGQWRVERSALEEYIQRRYATTKAMLASGELQRTSRDLAPCPA
jgi:excisionase family DNA binding protein